ncbi:MAG TPA: hypothetical protein VJH95_00295 [Candidatus Nanoarchaeia archaeon]|nr:hypothetical protein [Candidatus Nanoarchaeia archaeon]
MPQASKESKPGLIEAFEMNVKAERIILSYVWPFFVILLVPLAIVYNFDPGISERKLIILLAISVIMGIIVTIFHYRYKRSH